MLTGIDVSDYQGTVDWNAVAQSGRQFAFAKATEGTGYVAQTFATNWAGMRAAGLVRGAYHFARPDQNAPDAEADFFLAQLGDLQPGDLLVLDLETGSGDLSAWSLAWLARVSARVGVQPLLYSGTWFLAPHGCTTNPDLAQYGLWLAAYGSNAPDAPSHWSSLAFWQHTDAAQVPGIAGSCDESYFLGETDQLALYGVPALPAADPTPDSTDATTVPADPTPDSTDATPAVVETPSDTESPAS